MAYTPVLKDTNQRLLIHDPIFSDGFEDKRLAGAKYGTVSDPDSGKSYTIYGKSCGLRCACDAWAVEVVPPRRHTIRGEHYHSPAGTCITHI